MLGFLKTLFRVPSPAERLAVVFAVHPDVVRVVLDVLHDDEERTEMVLLYAAQQNLSPFMALDVLGAATGSTAGIDLWVATVGGEQILLAWSAFKAAPPRVRLWATLRSAASASDALMTSFEENLAKARAAIFPT